MSFACQFLDYQAWCREMDEEAEIQKIKADKQREETRIQHQKDLKNYRKKYGNYWEGPAGVMIPLRIGKVPALDGMNTCSWMFMHGISCMQTLLGGNAPGYTNEEYHDQFAELNEDGKWYWVCEDGESDDDDDESEESASLSESDDDDEQEPDGSDSLKNQKIFSGLLQAQEEEEKNILQGMDEEMIKLLMTPLGNVNKVVKEQEPNGLKNQKIFSGLLQVQKEEVIKKGWFNR